MATQRQLKSVLRLFPKPTGVGETTVLSFDEFEGKKIEGIRRVTDGYIEIMFWEDVEMPEEHEYPHEGGRQEELGNWFTQLALSAKGRRE